MGQYKYPCVQLMWIIKVVEGITLSYGINPINKCSRNEENEKFPLQL